MSKEKTLRTLEETEVMQATGIPTQEAEEVSTVLATEIIADLKKERDDFFYRFIARVLKNRGY